MARFSVFFLRLAVLASAGAVLFFCGRALAQGAGTGFETAPGSQMMTSTGQPVISVGPATPSAGVASQPGYGAFGDAAPAGMYVAPLGYGGAGAAPQPAPIYSAQNSIQNGAAQSGAPLTPSPGYSVQNQPSSGPFAAAPQPMPYVQQAYPLPQPYAYGAPTPDYTPQPYGPPYAQQPYMPPPMGYAQQPLPYAAQPAPAYAAAPQAMPQQPMSPQSGPPQNMPRQAPANYAAQSSVPYAAGTTGYGAVLPRNVANVAGAPQIEGGYTMGPGDKVRVTIYGETDLSGEYQIDGNGNIRLPLIGMMHAAGYTPGALEGWIRAALVPNYVRNPRINVEIVGYRPVYVVGAVQKPGQYSYINDMTLLNAVALAGGFTPQAKESTVYVRHEGETGEQAVPARTPLLIRPGDTVRVDTTLFWDAMNFLGPLSSPVAIAATVR